MHRTKAFGSRSTAAEVLAGVELQGKTFLVTGCAAGLGFETARALADQGASVIGLARSRDAAQHACRQLPRAVAVGCDLSEPVSVIAAVDQVRSMGLPLQALIANAGVMAPRTAQRKHGYELQFLVNHVGHHLLVTRLLSQLAPTGRVVVVSSNAHALAPAEGIRFADLACATWYEPWAAYGQSKLANILFVKQLALRLPHGQTANAVHPGIARTELQRHLPAWLRAAYVLGPLAFKTVEQAASTQCYAAAHPAAAAPRGEYFVDCAAATPHAKAQDSELGAKLWHLTEMLLGELGVPLRE